MAIKYGTQKFPKPRKCIKARPTRTFPDGRVVLSVAEWKQMRVRVYFEQGGVCAICHKYMKLSDFDLDHLNRRGMNASKRDDRRENLQATHAACNRLKDSQPRWSGKPVSAA